MSVSAMTGKSLYVENIFFQPGANSSKRRVNLCCSIIKVGGFFQQLLKLQREKK